ncbi:hypothetical protein HMPREF9970_2337 [Lachnoanaerobaculum saburreum F0468]|uniref:Uncharacterized protein n=1 Tax=Lachnoanaerobaculum saburreum F0468 TaxID=1095750 RepID=I0R7S7_9FIRM|nr:hypothetical protein HMPREF9970_2337 [Lachnoanaerobaculum saburreum F0468]
MYAYQESKKTETLKKLPVLPDYTGILFMTMRQHYITLEEDMESVMYISQISEKEHSREQK